MNECDRLKEENEDNNERIPILTTELEQLEIDIAGKNYWCFVEWIEKIQTSNAIFYAEFLQRNHPINHFIVESFIDGKYSRLRYSTSFFTFNSTTVHDSSQRPQIVAHNNKQQLFILYI